MNYLLINSHPYEGSFSVSAIKEIATTAQNKGYTVTEIDLLKDKFNPVMTAEDLNAWRQGKTVDPLVEKYQEAIEKADVIVFEFPIWWGELPAVLKGFCDKVLLPGWAYTKTEDGSMKGLLEPKKAIVVTTMETPKNFMNDFFGNPVENSFVKNTLNNCGIKVSHYLQIDKINSGGKEWTSEKMEDIKKLVD